MSDYTGKKCLSCGEEFASADDIVVCPDCGTPYHRECYKENGKCVNDALHKKNGSWLREQEIIDKTVCRICGQHNPPEAEQCSGCGRSLSLTGTTTGMKSQTDGEPITPPPIQLRLGDRLCGLNPDEDFDGVKVSEIADFIGANTYYYLPIFKRMKETGGKLSFNFSALFFTAYYYATRKMYGIAYIMALLSALFSLPALFIDINEAYPKLFAAVISFKDSNPDAFFRIVFICAAVRYIVIFIMCFLANRIYYRHTIRKIKKIKSSSESDKECAEKIRLAGGVSYRSMLPVAIFNVAITFAMLFASNTIINSI